LINSKSVEIWKKFLTWEVFQIGFPTSMQILGFFCIFLAILINFLKSKIDLDSQIFNSKSISDLKKFLWTKLFHSSKPSQPYFVSNFLSSGRTFIG
jgi:hypothetical protein